MKLTSTTPDLGARSVIPWSGLTTYVGVTWLLPPPCTVGVLAQTPITAIRFTSPLGRIGSTPRLFFSITVTAAAISRASFECATDVTVSVLQTRHTFRVVWGRLHNAMCG